jgi:hypothetical protein
MKGREMDVRRGIVTEERELVLVWPGWAGLFLAFAGTKYWVLGATG